MIWLKILLPLLLLGGVWWHGKQDRATQQELGAVLSRETQLLVDLAAKDVRIASLNREKGERNQKVLDDIAAAEEGKRKAKAEAAAAKADKERLAGQLAEAQRKYREVLNNDQSVQAYSRVVVPDAVIDLMRVANGEAIP